MHGGVPKPPELDQRAVQFPVTERWAWFDHATFGPLPRVAVDAVTRFVDQMSHGDMPEDAWLHTVDRVRGKAARLIACQPEDVAFLKSTAEGIGVVALGLDWQSGDEVVVYDREFPAGAYPWLNLAARGVEVRFVRDRGRHRFDMADVERLLTPRTRVVCVGLVNANNGFRAPVEKISELCRSCGVWLVVDATQALGALEVDIRRLGCDVLAAHCYKFMLAGYGTAICYFSARIRSSLAVPEPGWKSLREYPDPASPFIYELDFAEEARRFEPGVADLTSIVATEACLDLFAALGPAAVEARLMAYQSLLAGELDRYGYQVVSSMRAGERSGILSVHREGVDVRAIEADLRRRSVAVAVRDGRIRLSPHFYSGENDLDRLLAALSAVSR